MATYFLELNDVVALLLTLVYMNSLDLLICNYLICQHFVYIVLLGLSWWPFVLTWCENKIAVIL